MKGLALVLSPKGGSSKGAPLGGDEPAPDDEASEGKPASSEKEYARLASEAIADGDHDAAADALVSMVKACMGSYGPTK